jgi:hypothetical protein
VTAWLVAVALVAGAMQTASPPGRGDTKTIESTPSSLVDRQRQAVARTSDAWLALWKEHAGPGRPAPRVDFPSRMVVAVFLGSRPTGGFSVEILGTRRDGAALVVEWRERAPNPRDLTAQVLTSPAQLVEMPSHQGEVRFEQRQDRP